VKDHDRLETEFGTYAEWLAQAIASLSFEDPIPAACRGTGNPALFERLADLLEAGPDVTVLDVGCGIGGPGAWLMRERGCRVVGVDLMQPSLRGLKLLFPEFRTVRASTGALPFTTDAFERAWMLGVLEIVADKRRALAELQRVIQPGGRVVIYTFVKTGDDLDEVPEADVFERAEFVTGCASDVGFGVRSAQPVTDIPKIPDGWRDVTSRVRGRLWELHANDPLLERVELDLARISRLTRSREVEPWEFVLEK